MKENIINLDNKKYIRAIGKTLNIAIRNQILYTSFVLHYFYRLCTSQSLNKCVHFVDASNTTITLEELQARCY